MLIRRLFAVAFLASAVAGAGLNTAGAAPLPLPGPAAPDAGSDSLTVTVSRSGSALDARTYRLRCRPAAGTHPHPRSACEQLERNTRWGTDPFAPVPSGRSCTMIDGGPATAHIEGKWRGRPVDADFNRRNGCEVARWDKFGQVLTTR